LKKRSKEIVVIWIAIICVSILFISSSTVQAADDLTSTLDFITNVTLTDRSGNSLGADIAKDTDLRLTYDFSIPNFATVNQGDTFTLPIPDEILLTAGPDFDLIDGVNGGTIATVSYITGGLLVTFTDHAQSFSDITGSFYLELAFNESEIGNEDPTTITFEVGGTTGFMQIDVDFDQPPAPTTSVQKTGIYDAETGEIEWTVTVNQEAVEVLDGELIDVIPSGLTFVSDSLTIGGVAADSGDYTYIDSTLTYIFPTSFSTQQILTFRTTVDESEFIFTDSHGVTITESNSATLNHNGTVTLSNTAEVSIPISYIEKTGEFNSETKQIDWTIIVNQMGVTSDAVLTDSLADGLTLDMSSVEIDDVSVAVPSATVTYVDSLIIVDFGSISESHKLEFSTDVDASVFESNLSPSYSNTAILAGTNIPGNASDTAGPIPVSSSIISKNGAGYNSENAEITWKIVVNANEISIDNPIVTDLIPNGQEYVVGSATISSGAPGTFLFDEIDPDESHTGTLTYTFGQTITEMYTIEYRTKVSDPYIYATNQSNVTYSNEAKLEADNIPSSTSVGTQRVDSEVIEKTSQGYDYVSREISWKIQVNQNEMDLDSVVISDTISTGQEYVEGSFLITSDSGLQTGSFSNVAPTWTYAFDGSITEEYIITFKTRVTDITVFETNGIKTFSNTAEITSDLVPTAVLNSATQNVKNTVIGKSGDYTTGNTFIDWTITINTNDIPLESGTITDQLQEGLALDTNSVVLYHASVDSLGNVIQGEEITNLTGTNVVYNGETRLFEFNIPEPVSGGYILKFRTDVTDKSQSPFTNEASFNGSGTLNNGSDNPITVAWAGTGSSASGYSGSMNIIKVDREDNSILLEDAVFELVDRFGNVVQTVTTDENGSALFERVRFDVDYVIREVTPPDGYTLSSEEYLFQIDSGLADKDLTYIFQDTLIGSDEKAVVDSANSSIVTSTIEVTSTNETDEPLEGSTFILFDENGNEIAQATSGTDGIARFENIPYGNYTIKEIVAPDTYLLNGDIIVANVSSDGVVKGISRHIRNPKSPQTSDDIKVYMWILALSFVSLMVIFVHSFIKIRKKYNRK
jgi:uncharacterized repeat protein (TIGR01451 family)